MDKCLIVGLGNPGRPYANTRHNVGFWVVDEIARRHQLPAPRQERKALVRDGVIADQKVILAQPQTYMNLSGEAVRALSDFYKIAPDAILVAHDDIDLPLGTLRLKQTGGHGGQNGLRNIIQHLGTRDFPRVRFGVGRPPGKMAARDYVLQPFHGDDAIRAQEVVERAADAAEVWLKEGIELAMSRYNGDIDAVSATQQKASLDEQLEVAQRAHELAPNDPQPLEKIASLHRKQGHKEAAAHAHLRAAHAWDQRGTDNKANAQREQAAKLMPSWWEVHRDIAAYYEKHNNLKRAVSRHLTLAELQAEADALSAARETLARALALNPQHPRALELARELDERIAE